MTGNNTLELNAGTVIAALQHYFDTVLFAEGKAPLVTSVREDKGNYVFRVSVQEKEEKANATV